MASVSVELNRYPATGAFGPASIQHVAHLWTSLQMVTETINTQLACPCIVLVGYLSRFDIAWLPVRKELKAWQTCQILCQLYRQHFW